VKWVLVVAALLAYMAGGLSRISFNVDVLKMLPDRLGTVTGLSLFARHFSRPGELIVTVQAPAPEEADAAVKSLAASFRSRPELATRVVSESPWQSHPRELAEFLAYLLINQPPAAFQTLLERMGPGQIDATLADTKETMADSLDARDIAMAGYDPLGMTRSLDLERFAVSSNLSEFSSADGTFRLLYVEANGDMRNYRQALTFMNGIHTLADAAKLPPEVKLGYTGEPAYVAEISGRMQWDMMTSGFFTVGVIGLIFWLCYRRFRPLADLVGMLGITFSLSLATAGWVLGQISIIGVGFTSIMIGLSVDYGYMIYQSSLARPDPKWVRRQVLPYVLWAAGTTSAAFFTLNASSMPGLNHLGNLVGIGVLIGAAIMLGVFIRLVVRTQPANPQPPEFEKFLARDGVRRGGFAITAVLTAGLLGVLAVKGFPSFDDSGAALKLRHCEADDALEQIYDRLSDDRDFMSFVVTGANEAELLANVRALEPKLEDARKRGLVLNSLSPLPVCPDAVSQKANLAAAKPILADIARLEAAVEGAGFREDAFGLTKLVLNQWQAWSKADLAVIWPTNDTSVWILRRIIGREPKGFLAMGLMEPAPGPQERLRFLQGPDVHLVSWPLLADELRRVIPREFVIIAAILLTVLLGMLLIAFRSVRDVVLMTANMAVVFLAMIGAMRLFGWQWNAFNIASVMLLLGTGTDYSIYIILALERNGGSLEKTQRSTGLVVFLCAASAAAGFGSLAGAAHIGLASLGEVCAVGLALDALISVFLLPVAWKWLPGAPSPNREVLRVVAPDAAAH
jgi:predicted RND superfamily exporter protein